MSDLPAVKVGRNSSNGGAIRSGTNFIPCRYAAGEILRENEKMNFNANFYNVVSCFTDMDIFSNLLSVAVSGNKNIRQIQTKDTREQWGISNQNHDFCYGRHLYCCSKKNLIIPFWIGLDINKNNTSVTLMFERVTLNTLLPQNNIANFSGVCSLVPKHCNAQSSSLIERQLVSSKFKDLCDNHNPQILSDFMDEIFNNL